MAIHTKENETVVLLGPRNVKEKSNNCSALIMLDKAIQVCVLLFTYFR